MAGRIASGSFLSAIALSDGFRATEERAYQSERIECTVTVS
jgi:hypothetical protein